MEAARFTQNHEKEGDKAKFQKFLSTFTSLVVNIPLVEALNEILAYAQSKEKLVTKNRAFDCETIEISHYCNALFTRQVVTKRNDIGAFIIPCTISACKFGRALCDLGVSINLIPLMLFKQLAVNTLAPIIMKLLRLTGRSKGRSGY